MPCTDGLQPCDDHATAQQELEHNHDHAHENQEHKHSSEEDHCPPFCICKCCGNTIYLSTSEVVFSVNETKPHSLVAPYYFRYDFQYLSNNWQPPSFI